MKLRLGIIGILLVLLGGVVAMGMLGERERQGGSHRVSTTESEDGVVDKLDEPPPQPSIISVVDTEIPELEPPSRSRPRRR